MIDNVQCSGCGAALQIDDKDAVGYIPKQAFEKGQTICQRCFQLKHYNKLVSVSLTSDDYLEMVSKIHDKKGIVIHLIDLFDVQGTLLRSLPRIVGDKKVILVANKIDLLPKSTNKQKLKQWLYKMVKEIGLHVEEIFLISAAKGHYVKDVATYLEDIRADEDIYIVGVTNVGKSTFINYLIENSTSVKNAITTSYLPGTTLGFIHIPLDDSGDIIDTPGIVNPNQMVHFVSKADLKKIHPTKEIKPRIYQLNEQQTLFFGGLVRFDFVKGNRQSFVCYFSNGLPIHRTKLENATSLMERQIGQLLSPPNEETLNMLPPMTKQSYRITKPNTDIVFSGLGWVTITKGDVTVEINYPKGLAVTLRPSF